MLCVCCRLGVTTRRSEQSCTKPAQIKEASVKSTVSLLNAGQSELEVMIRVHTRDHRAPSSGCFSFIQSPYNDPMISINRIFIPCILKISQNQTIVFKTKHNFIQRLWFYLKSTLHWEIYRKAKVMFVFCKGTFHRPVCVQCSLTPAPPPSQFQLAGRPVKDGEQGAGGPAPCRPAQLSPQLWVHHCIHHVL